MNYSKYTNSLAAMDEIVALSNVIGTEDEELLPVIHTKWDELYTFVYANFKEPDSRRGKDASGKDSAEIEAELASIHEMLALNREEIEDRLYKIPPSILEQCFPGWMARYMLYFARVPVRPTKLTTFTKFNRLYGYMIKSSNKQINLLGCVRYD